MAVRNWQVLFGKSPGRLADLLADLLASSWERQFFELSLRNKRTNEEHIRPKFDSAEYDKKALGDQLDEFVSANKGAGNGPAFIKLRRQLSFVSNTSID